MSDDNNPVKISGGTIHVDTGDARVNQSVVPQIFDELAIGKKRSEGPSI